jgi:hypothetical protein
MVVVESSGTKIYQGDIKTTNRLCQKITLANVLKSLINPVVTFLTAILKLVYFSMPMVLSMD